MVAPQLQQPGARDAARSDHRLCLHGIARHLDRSDGHLTRMSHEHPAARRCMSLPAAALTGAFPVRSAVFWGRIIEVTGRGSGTVTGRIVVIIQRKRLRRIERFVSRLLGGRPTLRRPLDLMMSAVWELSDGSRNFEQICSILDELFAEQVAPVEARTAAALEALARNGCLDVLTRPFAGDWDTGPGVDPDGDLIEVPEWLDCLAAVFQEE